MKTSKNSKTALVAISSLVLGVASVHAQIIDVQFAPSYDNTAYSGTGADPLQLTATKFNLVKPTTDPATSATSSTVTATTGSTDYTVSLTAGGFSNPGDAANPLFSSYVYEYNSTSLGTPTGTFSIDGLTANTAFTLYLYDQSGGGGQAIPRPTTFTLSLANGGGIGAAAGTGAGTGFTAGANYAVIAGVSDGSGDINGTYSGAGHEADFNGFQLNLTTVVPEPSTYALFALGLAGLVIAARRRRQTV